MGKPMHCQFQMGPYDRDSGPPADGHGEPRCHMENPAVIWFSPLNGAFAAAASRRVSMDPDLSNS